MQIILILFVTIRKYLYKCIYPNQKDDDVEDFVYRYDFVGFWYTLLFIIPKNSKILQNTKQYVIVWWYNKFYNLRSVCYFEMLRISCLHINKLVKMDWIYVSIVLHNFYLCSCLIVKKFWCGFVIIFFFVVSICCFDIFTISNVWIKRFYKRSSKVIKKFNYLSEKLSRKKNQNQHLRIFGSREVLIPD